MSEGRPRATPPKLAQHELMRSTQRERPKCGQEARPPETSTLGCDVSVGARLRPGDVRRLGAGRQRWGEAERAWTAFAVARAAASMVRGWA